VITNSFPIYNSEENVLYANALVCRMASATKSQMDSINQLILKSPKHFDFPKCYYSNLQVKMKLTSSVISSSPILTLLRQKSPQTWNILKWFLKLQMHPYFSLPKDILPNAKISKSILSFQSQVSLWSSLSLTKVPRTSTSCLLSCKFNKIKQQTQRCVPLLLSCKDWKTSVWRVDSDGSGSIRW